MLLEKFKTAKQPEIQALRQLEYINMLPLPLRIERPSFLNALCAPNGNRPHVIAEFKRASPSRGDILMDFPPEEAAKQYAGYLNQQRQGKAAEYAYSRLRGWGYVK